MADKKISQLTNITGANLADADEFPVVDTSADETKAITFGQLKIALGTSTSFVPLTGGTMTGGLTVPTVDINGGTIDGTVIGGTTPAAGSFTTGSFTGDVSFGDNDKAIFGAGSDLQIYHDASNSYITEGGTGNLNIQSNGTQINLQKSDGTKLIEAINNGNVVLYSNGAERLRTNGTGVDVTGTITSDGLTVSGTGTFTNTTAAEAGLLVSGAASTGWGLEIASHNAGTASDLVLSGNAVVGHGTSVSYTVPTAGYYRWMAGATSNTGGTAGSSEIMRLTDTGNVGIGTSNPSAKLDVDGGVIARDNSTVQGTLAVQDAINYTGSSVFFLRSRLNGGNVQIGTETTGGTLYYPIEINGTSDTLTFANQTSDVMWITSSGNVGIGTSSPATALDVAGTVTATTVDLGNWTVTESSGVLHFATGGVNKMKLDATGNLTVVGDVTAFGTV